MGTNNKNAVKPANKKNSIITVVCVILVAAAVIGLAVYNSMVNNGSLLRSKVALSTENYEVSGTMMAYVFGNNYSSMAQYLGYFGVDTTKSLKDQKCSITEAEDDTWFDYFVNMSIDYLKEVLALCEGAKKDGIELDDADYENIKTNISNLKASAKEAGYSLKQYFAAMTGMPISEKDIRETMELMTLAEKYSRKFTDGLSYTAEEKENYYTANKNLFDGVDLYSFTIDSSDFTEKDADGNPTSDAAADSAKAKAEADKFAAAKTADEFKDLIRAYLLKNDSENTEENIEEAVEAAYMRHAVEADISSTASEKVLEAKSGTTYTDGEEGADSFTVYFIEKEVYRDETKNRAVRHLLVSSETHSDDTEAKAYYAEWEAAGFTADKLAELAKEHSEDAGSNENGGLYDSIAIGATANTFNAWLFDDARKVGDHDLIESEMGWHLMYYVGEAEDGAVAWQTYAESELVREDNQEMIEENGKTFVINYDTINMINA